MRMTALGHLQPGSNVVDIGATQLFGDRDQSALRAFLEFYADRHPRAKRPKDIEPKKLEAIAHDGFLGDLLILAGFEYVALDIFHATNTILFDLNIHEPGPDLLDKFDLVMNFGTTEHVFNQLRAFQSIHALIKVGGLCYHDLPMAGYPNHALYRYDPLFFSTLIPANGYEKIMLEITVGAERPVPEDLRAIGYRKETVADVGIEAIVKRTSPEPLHLPMETSTSLSVDPDLDKLAQSDSVRMPIGISVHYGGIPAFDTISFTDLTKVWLGRLSGGVGRRIRGR
jgi:hypothetical protein